MYNLLPSSGTLLVYYICPSSSLPVHHIPFEQQWPWMDCHSEVSEHACLCSLNYMTSGKQMATLVYKDLMSWRKQISFTHSQTECLFKAGTFCFVEDSAICFVPSPLGFWTWLWFCICQLSCFCAVAQYHIWCLSPCSALSRCVHEKIIPSP